MSRITSAPKPRAPCQQPNSVYDDFLCRSYAEQKKKKQDDVVVNDDDDLPQLLTTQEGRAELLLPRTEKQFG